MIEGGEDGDSDNGDYMDRDDDKLNEIMNTIAVINNVATMDVPDIHNAQPPPAQIEIHEYDRDSNILDPQVRHEFKHESVYEETHLFTRPISTTNTMEGFMSNVSFHERDLIEELLPNECIVVCRCNYGKVVYEKYIEPTKIRTTNRGRKKRQKHKKPRKKQGEGSDFNSQITFVSAPESALDDDGCVSSDAKVYKFKIFRTGKLQLPGARQETIDDVVYCAKRIADMLNVFLHPFEPDPAKHTNVININPVMKNYKFMLKLKPRELVDSELLKEVLAKEWLAQIVNNNAPNAPTPTPRIYNIKYGAQETKLSVTFDTPIKGKPNKKTRINIFVRGKINVLGAFESTATHKIIDYLHDLFTGTPELIAEEYVIPDAAPWEQNIEDTDEIGVGWQPEMPGLTDAEYDEFMDVVTEAYADYNACALEWWDSVVTDMIAIPQLTPIETAC